MQAFSEHNGEQEKHANQDCGPNEEQKGVTRKELIEQLEAHVDYFDKLPNHEKFSFAINADMYYFMILILNIFKRDLDEQ